MVPGIPSTSWRRRTWLDHCKDADWLKEDVALPARGRMDRQASSGGPKKTYWTCNESTLILEMNKLVQHGLSDQCWEVVDVQANRVAHQLRTPPKARRNHR
jgi:hypothetical protein